MQAALNHLHYNELPAGKRGGPRLYIEDNIDPERMAALMDVVDLKKTCFNVITKSGGTAETMSQYLIVTEALKAACGDDWKKHILITTSETKGFLIQIAKREGFKTFYIPDGVGGRFSELCPVGLIAAAVCGIDVRGLLAGAKDMDERCKTDEVFANPALLDAGLMMLAMNKGANMSVMMPYADSLKLMADWYAQLWAESLGKNVTLDGKPCNVGQTPIKTLGVTDQHSQLQLYTEGPFDKVITFLKVGQFRNEYEISHGCEEFPDVAFLGPMAATTFPPLRSWAARATTSSSRPSVRAPSTPCSRPSACASPSFCPRSMPRPSASCCTSSSWSRPTRARC